MRESENKRDIEREKEEGVGERERSKHGAAFSREMYTLCGAVHQ